MHHAAKSLIKLYSNKVATGKCSLTYQDGVSAPFPPEIAVVSGVGSRPDGVIWSVETKSIVWIELTSPWEEILRKITT